jgi:hypothetical protein
MYHRVFTIVMSVDPARMPELTRILDAISANMVANEYIRFPNLPSVHFASFTIFPPDDLTDPEPCSGPSPAERRSDPYLIFENNIDGAIVKYVDALLDQALLGLLAIVRCCRDGSQIDDRAALHRYLFDHLVHPSAFHIGTPWRRMTSVKDEAMLRKEIESFADGLAHEWGASLDPAIVREQIQNFVTGRSDLQFARHPEALPSLWDRWAQRIGPVSLTILAAGAALTLIFLTIPLLAIGALVLRVKESTDCEWKGAVDEDRLDALDAAEDRYAQNHMANINDVKPGVLRQITMRGVLFLANLTARFSTKGLLSDIPSIHFAHWSLLDGGKRLLFVSNFDGSWENYLDDFIDKGTRGLTGLWSNTVGFPRARFLFWGGAALAERFKAIARQKQVPARVWYSAYPRVTVETVFRNSTIRRDLFSKLDAAAVREWVRTL